ncbi:helix-turn-helix domain-containing protein [Bosea sp. (in: a-proteobacteria)]|uniref:helix-turn-helix domain-containing protein n=1 Tax=Bosea sp. (in: a-proteobacteria) TaxID=1871050 RepID=UPI002FCB6B50
MNIAIANRSDPLSRSAKARLAEAAVCAALRLSPAALRQKRRGVGRAAFGRQVAMYLAHVGFGLSLTQVGLAFGRDRTTVRHACALVEDRRDQPGFELALAALEAGLALRLRTLVAELGR